MKTDGRTEAFAALRSILAPLAPPLVAAKDTPTELTLVTAEPSPYPQHKGQPMWFGAVRLGKAYASIHLMPLYMNPRLQAEISPALKKRMQGMTCFNFKSPPDATQQAELERLAAAALEAWRKSSWA